MGRTYQFARADVSYARQPKIKLNELFRSPVSAIAVDAVAAEIG
jgi:hypothetical protein